MPPKKLAKTPPKLTPEEEQARAEEEQAAQEKYETDVTALMAHAREIAETLFPSLAGTHPSPAATKEMNFARRRIQAFLQIPDLGEEEFAADLKRAIAGAKVVFDVESPTPEQAFEVFDEFFPVGDGDEDDDEDEDDE
jgi:hypothetical protein